MARAIRNELAEDEKWSSAGRISLTLGAGWKTEMEKEGLKGTGSAYTIGKSGDVEFTEDLLERDSVELVVRGVGEILEIQERMQARADKG